MTAVSAQKAKLYEELVDVLNTLFGVHPGFRAAHAKGLVCEGSFALSSGAGDLIRAAQLQSMPLNAAVRFSNSTGVPNIPDGDPNATPKGMAIRLHTPVGDVNIVAHSANGFPVGTAEDFLLFLRAVAASGPGTPEPTPIQQFLASHPNALRFVQLPKPTPVSFATESFFGINAYRFVNSSGTGRFGRILVRPVAGEQHLDAATAVAEGPNFHFEELQQRLKQGCVQFRILVQLPNLGDPTHDASAVWPDDRKQVELGVLSITSVMADSDAAQRKLIFDPTHLIDGIELGDDPLPLDRAGVYSVSYARRNPK